MKKNPDRIQALTDEFMRDVFSPGKKAILTPGSPALTLTEIDARAKGKLREYLKMAWYQGEQAQFDYTEKLIACKDEAGAKKIKNPENPYNI